MLHFSETNAIFVMGKNSDFREIVFYKDYFWKFYKRQPESVKDKINTTLNVVEMQTIVSGKILKHIAGTKGLYEIRILISRRSVRVFCFFDKGRLVILANAFIKKSKKTPSREITKALRIKDEYEKEIK